MTPEGPLPLVDAYRNAAAALERALEVVAREIETARAALFVRRGGRLDVLATLDLSAGPPRSRPETPPSAGDPAERDESESLVELGPGDELHDRHGLVLLCPILGGGRARAFLGVGPRTTGGRDRQHGRGEYGESERAFLRCVAACVAPALENAVLADELRNAQRRRTAEIVQLRNLLDVGRELSGAADESAVCEVVVRNVMAHFVVSRCGLYLLRPHGLRLAHGRGLRRGREDRPDAAAAEAPESFDMPREPSAVAELPEGPVRRVLARDRFVLAVPIDGRRVGVAEGRAERRIDGLIAIGERSSGTPFSPEDLDFAVGLARLARTALENVRLHRVREEKQRQDRELQIAREIQRGLFPPRPPDVEGFELAALNRPCYEVGGDSYDWVPVEGGRLALVVADVAGKGTPASLLMAAVHASVRVLAGTAPPAAVVARLNEFLFESTRAGSFVTLFYAELEPRSRRLSYVNAGHVPPYRCAADGTVSRLVEGGPAMGLIARGAYEVGQVTLEPGDVVALITDGVTEAASPDDREFGDERVCEVLRRFSGGGAPAVVDGLVAAVDAWRDAAALRDDLTVLVLRAR